MTIASNSPPPAFPKSNVETAWVAAPRLTIVLPMTTARAVGIDPARRLIAT
jgi:hypothetical protein